MLGELQMNGGYDDASSIEFVSKSNNKILLLYISDPSEWQQATSSSLLTLTQL